MAPAAFADQIGDAAKKLGDASYDFAKEVDWNNGVFLQAPGIRALGGWARGLAVGLGRVMFASGDFWLSFCQTRFVCDLDTPDYLLGSRLNSVRVHGYRIIFFGSTALLVRFVYDRSLL